MNKKSRKKEERKRQKGRRTCKSRKRKGKKRERRFLTLKMELITEENGAKKVTLHISTEKKEYIREKKE